MIKHSFTKKNIQKCYEIENTIKEFILFLILFSTAKVPTAIKFEGRGGGVKGLNAIKKIVFSFSDH